MNGDSVSSVTEVRFGMVLSIYSRAIGQIFTKIVANHLYIAWFQ